MKVLDFTLSDFSSLQNKLIQSFDFAETSYHFLEPKDKEKNTSSFFRRIFMEGGFEVWVFSFQFKEEIIFKQIKSSIQFRAIHFFDFISSPYLYDFENKDIPSGIIHTIGDLPLDFRIKAGEQITGISFVYSKRWLDTSLLKTTVYEGLFNETYSIKKYNFNTTLKKLVIKLIISAKAISYNSFLMKMDVYTLLSSHLDLIVKELPYENIDKFSKDKFIQEIDRLISDDFEVSINKIYQLLSENRISKGDFTKYFKKKYNVSVLEFRRTIRMEKGLTFLKEGQKIQEVAKLTGFKTTSKFIECFRKTYGEAPKSYLKRIIS